LALKSQFFKSLLPKNPIARRQPTSLLSSWELL